VIRLKIDLRDDLLESLAKHFLEPALRCAVHVSCEFLAFFDGRIGRANGELGLVHALSLSDR